MRRRYATVDVFTNQAFGGNPVAVVLDAGGLSSAQMQAIASEFCYSETTFVLPPSDRAHTARVRIFTPRIEVPFAGHPNVGTAFVLARQAAQEGGNLPDSLLFEEVAGLVRVRLLRDGASARGAEVAAPEFLSRSAIVDPAKAAACLSLPPELIEVRRHAPQVVSVGLPFLVVELRSREALGRTKPNLAAFAELLPLDDADAVYAYTRDVGADGEALALDLQARMFSPFDGIVEDPATGSATAAVVALLAELGGHASLALRIGQGLDMGRPSLLLARAETQGGARHMTARVGGDCVAMMEGTFTLAGDLDPGENPAAAGRRLSPSWAWV